MRDRKLGAMPIVAHPHRMPRALSATALGLYERCPREFALSYLTDERDGRAPTAQMLLGTAVHATLASLARLAPAGRSEVVAHRLLRHHWAQAPRAQTFIHAEEEAAWGCQALALVSRFCAETPSDLRPFATEEWVRAQLPNGRRVCGRIDRADRTDGGLVIVDYKTGRRPEGFDAGGELAARIYVLAATRTFRMRVRGVRFWWLAAGREDVWEPDVELSQLEDELAELTEQVSTDRVMAPRPGEQCRRCPFRDRCPALMTTRINELPIATHLPF